MSLIKDRVLKISLDYINAIVFTLINTERLLNYHVNREEYEKCTELYCILLKKISDLKKANYLDYNLTNKEKVTKIIEYYAK